MRNARCLPWLAAMLFSCGAMASSLQERLSDSATPQAVSIGKLDSVASPVDRQSSELLAQRILPRGDDPPLLWPGGPEYPSKENPQYPKSKAADQWLQEPFETRPLLRPGRTDSAARVKWPVVGWWQHKGTASSNRLNTATASSSGSSAPPSKKSAWHRAAKAVLQQGKKAGKVGKLFKKQNNRRDLQLRDVLASERRSPALEYAGPLLAQREATDLRLLRRGQAPGTMRSAPSPSKPLWPTMFPLDQSTSDKVSRKQGSFSLTPTRKGKAPQVGTITPPPSPQGPSPKLSRATSEVGLKALTPKLEELKRAASSPSSTRATWRPRRTRAPPSPSFLHKGRPVWEDWGQYFKPLPQSAWGGGDIKIIPKKVRQNKPTGKNPGGLSKLFADEQQ